jgi:hypothetical protein
MPVVGQLSSTGRSLGRASTHPPRRRTRAPASPRPPLRRTSVRFPRRWWLGGSKGRGRVEPARQDRPPRPPLERRGRAPAGDVGLRPVRLRVSGAEGRDAGTRRDALFRSPSYCAGIRALPRRFHNETGSNRVAPATAEDSASEATLRRWAVPARTGDLLIVREEQLLRLAAVCPRFRSATPLKT